MDSAALLKMVEVMHREKNIPRDVIFDGVEAAIQHAVQKHFGDEEDVAVTVDRATGDLHITRAGEPVTLDPVVLGRIAAQSAKNMMIQKIREAECNSQYDNWHEQKSSLVRGTVQRQEGGAALVSLGKTEAILPRSEMIPGESFHVGDTVKAIVLDVRKVGHRVKIVLSRTHPEFVRQLFENEIPEINDRIIEIKAVAREAGYRTKIAVSSIDMKVDCVGACVGVRGSRIKNIVEELGGERIDIVRWNDSLQVLIPNALQPAAIEEVFLYPRLGRAIVLVKEDQLSLAIGRRGQNVRLASKLVGWDIEIMTHEEYNDEIEKAVGWFSEIPNVQPELVEAFIEEGFLSYDDLTFMEPAHLAELGSITEDEAEEIIAFAEDAAERVEAEEKVRKAAEAEARALAPAAPRPTAQSRALEVLGGEAPAAEAATAGTGRDAFDSLFVPAGQPPAADEENPPTPPAETEPAVEEGSSEQEIQPEEETIHESQDAVVEEEQPPPLPAEGSEEPTPEEVKSEE
jgi:N utilization substance protein A